MSFRIGGPGTVLPVPLESLLCWCLALSNLSVSGYYYWIGTQQRWFWRQGRKRLGYTSEEEETTYLPLVICSQDEIHRYTPEERYEQLVTVLLDHFESKINAKGGENKELVWDCLKEDLITLLRDDIVLRRLATLALRCADQNNRFNQNLIRAESLARILHEIWPRILRLPDVVPFSSFSFAISLIVPCYGEEGSHVHDILSHCLEMATNPCRIQVIVVDAGNCRDLYGCAVEPFLGATSKTLEQKTNNRAKSWGQVQFVSVRASEGGRGATMNEGARHAKGGFYAFLHSDTRLPRAWDDRIVETMHSNKENKKAMTAYAFAFGIDTSRSGLRGGPYPPGIKAIEVTANLRCRWWSLPYGDQCLCLEARIFDYLGGFPHQCIMEDYELVCLLHRRGSALSDDEGGIQILPGPPVLCSPRRWQRYGVLYVTYCNSHLVKRYNRGESPESIFKSYYGVPPHHGNDPQPKESPIRPYSTSPTPWERQVQERLKKTM